jgi:hypothetical protein
MADAMRAMDKTYFRIGGSLSLNLYVGVLRLPTSQSEERVHRIVTEIDFVYSLGEICNHGPDLSTFQSFAGKILR